MDDSLLFYLKTDTFQLCFLSYRDMQIIARSEKEGTLSLRQNNNDDIFHSVTQKKKDLKDSIFYFGLGSLNPLNGG